MRYVSFAAAVAILAFPAGALPAQTPPRAGPAALDSTDLGAWLDGLVPFALQEGDLAGAVIVVVKDGRILLAKGYGFADVARKVPMDPVRTVVGVGSVSKAFTWTAVMQQVEQGRLDLDRDVNAYLDFEIPPAFGKPVTLRRLMTHTAGFEEQSFRTRRSPRALREYLQQTSVPERIAPPGDVVAYSNYGAMLAGYVVERVSGERFVDYVAKHILEPLAMDRSTFRRPVPPRLAPDLSPSYDEASGGPRPVDALDHEEPSGDPSGHLVTTGSDISRFMLAHLQHGRYEAVRLLDSATADLMHAPAFEPLPGANPVTLGFFRTDWNGRRIIAHPGDIEGFHADVELLLDERVGFFLALNSSGVSRGLFPAAYLFRTSLFRGFMNRYFPGPPVADEPTTTTAREHARLVAGEYQMSRRPHGDFAELETLLARAAMGLVVKANDDGTITTPSLLDFERGRARTWREVGPFMWREVGGTGRLDMRVENGRVKALLPRDLLSFVLEPVPWTKAAKPNIALLIGAFVILSLSVIIWVLSAVARRRAGTSARAELRPVRIAALIGLAYLLAGAVIVTSGVATKEGAELWIRLMQVVGLLAVAGAAVSVRAVWTVSRSGLGRWAVIGTALIALAMLETVWLSFGFHLISARLVY